MIRKLRRKFILINLLLVGLVLTVVFALLVGANARRLEEQSEGAMRMALNWQDGERPRFEIGAPYLDPLPQEREDRFSLVPVFVVTVENGAVAAVNDGGQVEVSEQTAEQAAVRR